MPGATTAGLENIFQMEGGLLQVREVQRTLAGRSPDVTGIPVAGNAGSNKYSYSVDNQRFAQLLTRLWPAIFTV